MRLLLCLWASLATTAAFGQSVVPREPSPGGLRRGEVVFVNDGTCPKGQLRRVEGIYTRDNERQSKGQGRLRACVAVAFKSGR